VDFNDKHLVSLRFSRDEGNAARRMLLRLQRDYGFHFGNEGRVMEAVHNGQECRIRIALGASGECELIALNQPSADLLNWLHQKLIVEWQDPSGEGPTGRHKIVDPKLL
jgi:hypothetical protein